MDHSTSSISGSASKTEAIVSGPRELHDEVGRLAADVDWDAALPAGDRSRGWRAVKRLIDIVVSAVALVLLAPAFVLFGVLIVLDSGWPVLYPWRVVGYRGRRFAGYKLRTMVLGADKARANLAHLNEMSGPVFKIRDDPRVTRLGRFLRRYSLDELPQLWSVLRGEMSLVGPRPMFSHEFAECSQTQRLKLAVTPGMTCLWQVSGRAEISDFNEWVRLDLQYIREWSLWLDLSILWRTLLMVVRGRGAY